MNLFGYQIVRLILNIVFYKRYLDDTFILFNHPSHGPLFLQYMNNQHPNGKRTKIAIFWSFSWSCW